MNGQVGEHVSLRVKCTVRCAPALRLPVYSRVILVIDRPYNC